MLLTGIDPPQQRISQNRGLLHGSIAKTAAKLIHRAVNGFPFHSFSVIMVERKLNGGSSLHQIRTAHTNGTDRVVPVITRPEQVKGYGGDPLQQGHRVGHYD